MGGGKNDREIKWKGKAVRKWSNKTVVWRTDKKKTDEEWE